MLPEPQGTAANSCAGPTFGVPNDLLPGYNEAAGGWCRIRGVVLRRPGTLSPIERIPMTKQQVNLCDRLKRLGFSKENQLKLYGQEFDLVSDPIVMGDDLVFVDAIERKSRQQRRVRVPLPIVHMANRELRAA